MITRRIRLQLLAFLLVAVVGTGYVGFRYGGLDRIFGATTYPVHVQLPDSGGIFTGADVTYRGVSVGRVGPLTLTAQGVDVQLDIDRGAPEIPADVDAQIRNLSAIGEQYVDLQPATDGGPVLESGSVIPAGRASAPVPVEELVVSLDDFVRSVPLDSLRTVVDQLGVAFADTALPLQKLLDTSNAFTAAAVEALPPTLTLLRDGRTVLDTQRDVSEEFRSFSRDLALLADQLKTSDPDLRRLIATGPQVSDQLTELLRESGPGLSWLVADLLTVSRIAEPRQDGLRQVLVTFPGITSNGFTAVPGDGTGHLGLVLNVFDPFPCAQGYEGTTHRDGRDTADTPVNEEAYCAEPPGTPKLVRGAQNVPAAETPMPPADAQVGDPALPAGSVSPDSATPMSSPAQILLDPLP
ncbi:MCE family protein [Pseudonocardia bannensis]|uniref:MCE family protein n=1 Tax=Pseudonocardia bannensis TaxID=630973 RepID=A0A848DST5_9PSEU|nr:MlaD family protein [Pseudonocardia bannensis]NMH95549.1 MCE family protein [Pseudonocardia bannensis]